MLFGVQVSSILENKTIIIRFRIFQDFLANFFSAAAAENLRRRDFSFRRRSSPPPPPHISFLGVVSFASGRLSTAYEDSRREDLPKREGTQCENARNSVSPLNGNNKDRLCSNTCGGEHRTRNFFEVEKDPSEKFDQRNLVRD